MCPERHAEVSGAKFKNFWVGTQKSNIYIIHKTHMHYISRYNVFASITNYNILHIYIYIVKMSCGQMCIGIYTSINCTYMPCNDVQVNPGCSLTIMCGTHIVCVHCFGVFIKQLCPVASLITTSLPSKIGHLPFRAKM